MFRTLRGRITAAFLLVVLISLFLASLVFIFFLARYIRDRERDDLLGQVGAIAEDISRVHSAFRLPPLAPPPLNNQPAPAPSSPNPRPDRAEEDGRRLVRGILNTEAEVLKVKLLLVAPGGMVVAESMGRPRLGERTVELPEDILSRQGPRITERFFRSLGKDYLIATAPTLLEKGEEGYLLAIKPLEETRPLAASLVWYMVIAGLFALGMSAFFALYLSGAISRPVREVTAAARRMAEGDYEQEVPVRGSDETAELARDFNLMARRVREAYELQRNFAGNVSHELRTPLTSIEGFSQALLDGVSRSEEEKRRSLEIINQESRRLVRVLRDLLLLSQIDAGELRGESRPVDITDLMRKLESMYRSRAEEAGIAFEVTPPASALTIHSDPDRLERVITNLLDNAFKYTGEGGTVAFSAVELPGYLHIHVTDNGRGIPQELLPRIFERFYRAGESQAAGAGLGLSICKELVDSLGGKITVGSLPGQGTTFTVVLPLG